MTGADPGLPVGGGHRGQNWQKGADFARFWPILEGQCPHTPLLDPPLSDWHTNAPPQHYFDGIQVRVFSNFAKLGTV